MEIEKSVHDDDGGGGGGGSGCMVSLFTPERFAESKSCTEKMQSAFFFTMSLTVAATNVVDEQKERLHAEFMPKLKKLACVTCFFLLQLLFTLRL